MVFFRCIPLDRLATVLELFHPTPTASPGIRAPAQHELPTRFYSCSSLSLPTEDTQTPPTANMAGGDGSEAEASGVSNTQIFQWL